MKQRIYIDTSVFGGYFDENLLNIQFLSRELRNEFILLFSAVTQDELENAPESKETCKGNKAEWTDYLDITDEAVNLLLIILQKKLDR